MEWKLLGSGRVCPMPPAMTVLDTPGPPPLVDEAAVIGVVRELLQQVQPGRDARVRIDSALDSDLGIDSLTRVESSVAKVPMMREGPASRRAYADSAAITCLHTSSVPAAAMRERGTRSSGASTKRASPSTFATVRPRSRRSS